MKYRAVRPEMGCYFYTRCGRAAYVAYAMCCGSPLPIEPPAPAYAKAVGFILGMNWPICWMPTGESPGNPRQTKHDLVERITMECAFQYPNRRQRPKPPAAETQGRLL